MRRKLEKEVNPTMGRQMAIRLWRIKTERGFSKEENREARRWDEETEAKKAVPDLIIQNESEPVLVTR